MYLDTNVDEVKNKIRDKISELEKDAAAHGGYEKWWETQEEIRRAYQKYVVLTDVGVAGKICLRESGWITDHHMMADYAPLRYKRIGFDAVLRSPAEHLGEVASDLKKHGIRFIYVALPEKQDIYIPPDLDMELSCENNQNSTYRLFLHELLNRGVECVDCYPEMLKYKNTCNLFSNGHAISLEGADVIARLTSRYLLETTTVIDCGGKFRFERREERIYKKYIHAQDLKFRGIYMRAQKVFNTADAQGAYLGIENPSAIGIIGDCNLGEYETTGAGIPSNIAFYLQSPVEYLGRYLPFCPIDRINRLPAGSLAGKKLLIYIGFAAASFIRASRISNLWNIDRIPEKVYHAGGK